MLSKYVLKRGYGFDTRMYPKVSGLSQ